MSLEISTNSVVNNYSDHEWLRRSIFSMAGSFASDMGPKTHVHKCEQTQTNGNIYPLLREPLLQQPN